MDRPVQGMQVAPRIYKVIDWSVSPYREGVKAHFFFYGHVEMLRVTGPS